MLGGFLIGMFFVFFLVGYEEMIIMISKIFNLYIILVWLVIVNVVLIMLLLIKFFFKNFMVLYMVMKFNCREVKRFVVYFILLMLLVFFGMVCFWGIISDLFIFVFG